MTFNNLPIGTVVTMKNVPEIELMITGKKVKVPDTVDEYYDYTVCLFPHGETYSGENVLFIKSENIEQVTSMGCTNLDIGLNRKDGETYNPETDDYLPIGTVVLTKRRERGIITGFTPYSDTIGEYTVCDYPSGRTTDGLLQLNKYGIKKILFLGNISDKHLEFNETLKEYSKYTVQEFFEKFTNCHSEYIDVIDNNEDEKSGSVMLPAISAVLYILSYVCFANMPPIPGIIPICLLLCSGLCTLIYKYPK